MPGAASSVLAPSSVSETSELRFNSASLAVQPSFRQAAPEAPER